MSTVLGQWVAALIALSQRRARITFALIVALTLAATWVVWRHAAVDSDLGKLIKPSGDVTWYAHNERYKAAFPEQQQTAVVVVSGSGAAAVSATARSLAQAFQEAGGFDFVFAPAQGEDQRRRALYYLTEDDRSRWLAGTQYDVMMLNALGGRFDLATLLLAWVNHQQTRPETPLPTLTDSLIGALLATGTDPVLLADGVRTWRHLERTDAGPHYDLIVLKGPQNHADRQPNATLVSHIRGVIANVPKPTDVTVRLTGEVPLAHEEMTDALDGIGIAGTLSLVMLALILGLGIRNLRIIGAIFALLGVGIVWTLAYATMAVGSMNTLSLIFVVMFFGLGVDFAMHLALAMREQGNSAGRAVGPSLIVCMLSTAIGFLAFAPTDYHGLAQLGVICAGAMVIATGLAFTLLPALFVLLRIPGAAGANLHPSPHDRTDAGQRAAGVPLSPRLVIVLTLALALMGGWQARGVEFDYSVLALRDAEKEGMQTLLELQERGISTDYSIVTLVPDDAAARALRTTLLKLPEVGAVQIPGDLVPDNQAPTQASLAPLRAMLATLPSLPIDHSAASAQETPPLESALLALGRLADGSEDPELRRTARRVRDLIAPLVEDRGSLARIDAAIGRAVATDTEQLRTLATTEPFTLSQLPDDLRARLIDPNGRHLVTIQPAGAIANHESTGQFIEAVAAVVPNYAGRAVVEWGVGEVVVKAFLEAVALAVGGIALLLIVYYRGLLLPLCALVPLTLTAIFTFAGMALSGIDFNMANILVVPLIFGLGVDSGIHVIDRVQHDGGVRAIYTSSTARAVIISALTTIGTFFSLSFSPHKGAASIGLLLTGAISLMLVITLVVLPALLQLLPSRLYLRTRHSRDVA